MENRLEHFIEGIVMDYTELYLSELEVLALFLHIIINMHGTLLQGTYCCSIWKCLPLYIYIWFYAYNKYFDIITNYLSSCTFTHLTKRNQSKAHILYTEWAPRGSPRPHG